MNHKDLTDHAPYLDPDQCDHDPIEPVCSRCCPCAECAEIRGDDEAAIASIDHRLLTESIIVAREDNPS